MSTRVFVFVYGTLLRGQANHRVLEGLGAEFVGPATTAEVRTLVDLGPYPALLPSGDRRGESHVDGEIYGVDEHALAELDDFEGCPDLYMRETIMVDVATSGARIEVWTYVLARAVPDGARVVADGRYAGGGVVLPNGARDVLDKSPEFSDVPAPRGRWPRGPG